MYTGSLAYRNRVPHRNDGTASRRLEVLRHRSHPETTVMPLAGTTRDGACTDPDDFSAGERKRMAIASMSRRTAVSLLPARHP